jgi:hypothetical protein
MDFPTPRSAKMESALSLQHIFRVARAVNVDPSTSIEGAVVYIVDENDTEIVSETWNAAFEDKPSLAIIVVDGLPRGARVEWHVIRCQKWSDEPKTAKFRMAFDEHQVVTAITELRGNHGMLCITFGSSKQNNLIRSKYANLVLQSIPTNAVFSVKGTKIERHPLCTIILTE